MLSFSSILWISCLLSSLVGNSNAFTGRPRPAFLSTTAKAHRQQSWAPRRNNLAPSPLLARSFKDKDDVEDEPDENEKVVTPRGLGDIFKAFVEDAMKQMATSSADDKSKGGEEEESFEMAASEEVEEEAAEENELEVEEEEKEQEYEEDFPLRMAAFEEEEVEIISDVDAEAEKDEVEVVVEEDEEVVEEYEEDYALKMAASEEEVEEDAEAAKEKEEDNVEQQEVEKEEEVFSLGDRGEWQIPNDFKLFLTQCSIQSFMFLLSSMRDPQTVFWLEKFTQPSLTRRKSKSNYTMSFNTTNYNNETFSGNLKLSRTNATSLTTITLTDDFADVSTTASTDDDDTTSNTGEKRQTAKLLQYHGLGALNTTLFPSWEAYFAELLEQPAETFLIQGVSAYIPEYELEIDPSSLCSRILSVREQIAREFVKDLQVIAEMGGHTLDSYWESLRQLRDSNTTDSGDFKVQRQSLLFLEFNPDDNGMSLAPSPLRKGNFDLLTLLTTQEAIHRVLNDKSRTDAAEQVTNEFLRTFYTERLHYFTGIQRYGRADDFLEELLASAPRMITVGDGVTSLIDPTRIAELILTEREHVALDWKQQAEESPAEHMAIQKMRLNKMMGTKATDDEQETTFQ